MKLLMMFLVVLGLGGVIGFLLLAPYTEVMFFRGKSYEPYQTQRFYFSGISPDYELSVWPWPTNMNDVSSDWVELQKVGYRKTHYYRYSGLCIDCQFAVQITSEGNEVRLKALGVIEAGKVHFVYLNPQPPLERDRDYTISGGKSAAGLSFRLNGDGKLYWPKPKY